MPPIEHTVPCPKCGVAAGEPCRSIRHEGYMAGRVYRTHKKRRRAVYLRTLVPRVLSTEAVPVRLTRSRQVGAVDSAVKSLPLKDNRGVQA